jgi:hypothetical protein
VGRGGAVGELAHHLRHDLRVGVDVRGGDVHVGTDEVLQLVDETQRDVLDLLLRVGGGVDAHPALGPSEGDVHDGRLPGHVGGQRLEEVEGDVLVVADPALVGAADLVVLDAVGLELLGAALLDPEEPALGDAQHPFTERDVRLEQGAAVEDELSVGQRLEGLAGLHRRRGEVLEVGLLLLAHRDQPIPGLDGDVEDVLEVGLLELELDPRVEVDEVGRPVEGLHRLVEDALPGTVLA